MDPKLKRPGSPVLFAICMVTILAIGWLSDNRSCIRQSLPRKAVNAQNSAIYTDLNTRIHSIELHMDRDSGKVLAYDYKEIKQLTAKQNSLIYIRALSCQKVFPDT